METVFFGSVTVPFFVTMLSVLRNLVLQKPKIVVGYYFRLGTSRHTAKKNKSGMRQHSNMDNFVTINIQNMHVHNITVINQLLILLVRLSW